MRETTTKAWMNKYLPVIKAQFEEERKRFEANMDPEKKGQAFIISAPLSDKDPVNQIALIAMVDELHDRIEELEERCKRAEDALAAYVLPPEDQIMIPNDTK